ncbi:unnamed protein product, partial [Prorocentrum cordatum]
FFAELASVVLKKLLRDHPLNAWLKDFKAGIKTGSQQGRASPAASADATDMESGAAE